MNVDFGLTTNDYAKYRAGFPDEFFARVFDEDIVKPGASLVDLGTGTGTLARGFALRGCRVTVIDPSASMMEQARVLDQQAGVKVDYRVAKAEQTDLPDSFANIVSAGQCWHWFDRPHAARESKRILKEGGTLLLAHFDWIPLKDNVVELTEKLIEKHNPKWNMSGGYGLHGEHMRDIREAGFKDLRTFSFDIDVPYSPEAWRGRIRASAGVGASLAPEAIARFDSELKQLLEERMQTEGPIRGGQVLPIPHRVFVIHAQK